MLGNALQGWHLLALVLVVLLLFGSTKLPQLAKGIGQSMRIFTSEMRDARSADPDPGGPPAEGGGEPGADPGGESSGDGKTG